MHSTAPELPKNDKDLAFVMRQHGDREFMRIWPRMIRWNMASMYLSGERRFEFPTPYGGSVRMEELELENSTVPMHVENLCSIHNRIVGMLNGLDLGPRTLRDDSTLAAIRDRALSQVILDAAVPSQHVDTVKRTLLPYFTYLGGVGIHSEVGDYPSLGLTGEMEVVHPREIYPYPSVSYDLAKVRGIMRDRWIPWTVAKEAFGLKGESMPLDGGEYEFIWRQPGEGDYFNWGTSNPIPMAPRYYSLRDYEPTKNSAKVKLPQMWLRVRELWRYGSRNTVDQYVAATGTTVLAKEKYDQVQAYCPLTYGRFYECGDFHGAGLYDLIFSCVREFEKLIRDMVNNVREIDKFTTLVLPAGTIDEKKYFTDNRSSLRALVVDPEPKGLFGTTSAQPLRPVTITPPNSGTLPGQTAQFLLNIIKDLSPLRDIVEDKGRVDSFSGLQFLQDEAQRPMANPVSSLVNLFGESYRYIASQAFNVLSENPTPVPVGRLSLDLVGAVIDPETSTVSFAGGRNQLPDIARLRFGVKQNSLKMLAARKSEAVEMLKLGLTDRTDFIITAIQEGLDFALYMDPQRSAYDSVLTNIITLYGDGQTPGEIVSAPYMESPDMQLRILNGFMQSPKMRVASTEVIDAFSEYQQTLINWTGKVLPQAMPDPLTMLMQNPAYSNQGMAPAASGGGARSSRPTPSSQGPPQRPMR